MRGHELLLDADLAALYIDKHFADTGRYPASLEELANKKYIGAIPTDPFTQSPTSWVVAAPADVQQGAVYDVRSGAKGTGRDGKPYEQW